MKFKIDTTAHYTRILPVEGVLSDRMAAELLRECQSEKGVVTGNWIVDFSTLPDAEAIDENAVFERLLSFHEQCYNEGCSLVFTGFGSRLLAQFKSAELHHVLNLTPTLPEAIDMVNMEILERDLFNEDEP